MSTISEDYGIKYKVNKISDDTYILLPIDLVEGYCSGTVFYDGAEYKVLCQEQDLHSDIIVTNVYNKEELLAIYGIDDIDELEFVKSYFLAEERDKAKLIRIKDGHLLCKSIDIRAFLNDKPTETYEKQKNKPAVTLNETALEQLLNIEQIDALKVALLRYRNILSSFHEKEHQPVITRIEVTEGYANKSYTDTPAKGEIQDKKLELDAKAMSNISSASQNEKNDLGSNISFQGLEKYIKERVFGHDAEIRSIAKSVLMNYTAHPEIGEKNESILLIGPTGTGKTETIKAIIDYLDIPLLEVNAANLVPQGIKGMSLEDCLYSLIISSGYKIDQAQKGLVFFDEFDKLGVINYDSKTAVVQILLKFIEGDTFMIDKPTGNYNFNTSMLIKIFAGAFSNLFTQNKTVGFGNHSQNSNFDLRTITDSQYFGKELVTRIPHVYVYHELDRETQKSALLRSKLSTFLLKKQRYQRQFGVTLQADDTYIEAILNALDSHEKSMRDLNNLVLKSLDEAECEMLSNPTSYKRLVLTRDTISDNRKFDLS